MGIWQVISRFIPKFWKGIKVRNQIKSIHIENLHKLENGQKVVGDFDGYDESLLGEYASKNHFKAKSEIQAVGSPKNGKYYIHNKSDREKIKELSKSAVLTIRIRNILSVLFWGAAATGIVILAGKVVGLY